MSTNYSRDQSEFTVKQVLPMKLFICEGNEVILQIGDDRWPPPCVQWQVLKSNKYLNKCPEWEDLRGENDTCLIFKARLKDQKNKYRAIVKSKCECFVTNSTTLEVGFIEVVKNPVQSCFEEGEIAMFMSEAEGRPEPSIQWQVSTNSGQTWENLEGETSDTLSFVMEDGQQGNLYRAVFRNKCGQVISLDARLLFVQAAFTFSPELPLADEEIQFTDESIGDIVSWEWDFGDGDTSDLQNPTHSYMDNGDYMVTLTITDSNGCTDTTSTLVSVGPAPELTLVKTADPMTYNMVGDIINYEYLVTNTGNVTITAITVVDDKTTVSCPPGDLNPGESMTCFASYMITDEDLNNGSVTNTAFANGTFDEGPVNSNESSVTVFRRFEADLSISKIGEPDSVTAGNNLTYTLDYNNNGPDDAQDVMITDTLPPGVIFVSAVSTHGSCSESGGVVTCNLGTLPNSASGQVIIVVTVPGDTPNDTELTNNTEISSTTFDPNPGNNTDSVTTTVTSLP